MRKEDPELSESSFLFQRCGGIGYHEHEGDAFHKNGDVYKRQAKISGQKKFSTIVHHILPNIMPTIIVAATMNIANAILMESALSFFGLGIPVSYTHLDVYKRQV